MKIYFDTLEDNQSNLSEFDSTKKVDYWLTSRGTSIKRILREINKPYDLLDDLDEPGVYFIDVNADPNWWGGQCIGETPDHILSVIPQHLVDLVKNKKLRLIISADKEGGPMVNEVFDVFKATTDLMKQRQLPAMSVLILQGNKKINDDYNKWLEQHNEEQLFEVQYSNHFGNIFFDDKMPISPCILDAMKDANSLSFNSLNRVYRPHRAAHAYYLLRNNLLSKGKVSYNTVQYNNDIASRLAGVSTEKLDKTQKKNFPIFVDGNWSQTNAAWNYNKELYQTTLLTVVTETIFVDNTAFVTEKIFKPIALGHPFLLIAGEGTLRALNELGFRTDFAGIDESYDSISDPKIRFATIHKILSKWANTPRQEQLKLLEQSMEAINHNFNLIRSSNFYHDAIKQALESSEKYFND